MTRTEAAAVLRGLAEVAERRHAEQPMLAAYIAIQELQQPFFDPDAVEALCMVVDYDVNHPKDRDATALMLAVQRVRASRQP